MVGVAVVGAALVLGAAGAALAEGGGQEMRPRHGMGMMQDPGMMGQGMMGRGMRHGMMDQGMGRGMRGDGMRHGMMDRGMAAEAEPEPLFPQLGPRVMAALSTEDVRLYLERQITAQDFERLKVGAVEEVDAGTITAEIVTVDDSLVQKLAVDRHTGLISRAE
jgi:ribosomal protein L15